VRFKKLPTGAGSRSRLPSSVRMLPVLLLSVVAGCVTLPPANDGCIGQSDAVLEEIASGSLVEHNPATAAWEREWHRACPDA